MSTSNSRMRFAASEPIQMVACGAAVAWRACVRIVIVVVIVVVIVIYTKRVSITRYPSLYYARGLETIADSCRPCLLVEYHPDQCRQ